MDILLISTFGPNIRGVSPYADSLADNLISSGKCNIDLCDYKIAFPKFLLPANTNYEANNEYATIDYHKPSSWNVLRDKSYDVVHFQYWSPAFLPIIYAVIKIIKRYPVKIIVTLHNPKPHEKLPLFSYLEKILLNNCHGIICHTERGKQIIKNLVPDTEVSVIHHGCKIYEIEKPIASDYALSQLDPNYDYVLFFGNIRPYKGLDKLLDAWKEVSHQFPMTKLIIAGRLWKSHSNYLSKTVNLFSGHDKYAKKIQQKLNSTENLITDLDFIPQDKLISYIKIAKLAIFPYTFFESQSGATCLAAAHGLPCVVSNLGGLKQIAIDKTFIIEDSSITSLASQIKNKLYNYSSQWRIEQNEIAKSLSWESSSRLHLNFYKKILES